MSSDDNGRHCVGSVPNSSVVSMASSLESSNDVGGIGKGGGGGAGWDQIMCGDGMPVEEDHKNGGSSSCSGSGSTTNDKELSHLSLLDVDVDDAVENSGPTNIDQIFHRFYLGNLAAACDTSVLTKYKINYILTIDSCPLPSKITHLPHVQTKYIQISDMPREDILCHFEETYDFIEQALREGNESGAILVHCYFGVSRSATITLAYMMRKWEISLEEAQERLKARRSMVGPNFGFLSQLKLYEKMRFRIDKRNLFYRRFRLRVASDKVKSVKILPHPYTDVIKPDPSFSTPRPEPVVYQCRKCRRVLAAASNLLTHFPRKTPSWFDFSEEEVKGPLCTEIIYVEPIAWMTAVHNNLQGKLYCPNQNCKSKLGSFSWIVGCLCPCGAKVQPAFYFVPSKVDRSTSVLNLQITI